MRELGLCEMAQWVRPGRERRGLRRPSRPARPARCPGAARPEAVAAGTEVRGMEARRAEAWGTQARGTVVAANAARRGVTAARAAGVRHAVPVIGSEAGPVDSGARGLLVGPDTREPLVGPDVRGLPVRPDARGLPVERACPAVVDPVRPLGRGVEAPAAPWPGGPRPAGAGDAIVPAPRTIRPPAQRCTVPARRRSPRRRARVRPAGERFLVGVATVVCSATVVVLLGLLGTAADGWNAAPAAPAGTVATQSTGG